MTVAGTDIAAWVASVVWPLLRILGVFAVAPVLGGQGIPARVRIGLALAITLLLVPLLPAPVLDGAGASVLVLVSAEQLLIGICIGFALRLVFAAVELGAQVIALQMGLGFAELVDPQNGTNVPTLSHFYVMIGTLVFLALNGHLLLIDLLLDSFRALPPGAGGIGGAGLWALAGWGSEMFRGAVMLALPATAALVSMNVVLGVMTRAVPQFNMFVAFPALLLLGMLIVVATLPALLPRLRQLLDSMFEMLRGAVLVVA